MNREGSTILAENVCESTSDASYPHYLVTDRVCSLSVRRTRQKGMKG